MNPNPMNGGLASDAFGAMVSKVRAAGNGKKSKKHAVMPPAKSSSPPPHHASKHHVKGVSKPGVALLKSQAKGK